MTKVYINPNYLNARPDKADGGIRRVCEAQIKHLPSFGVEVVGKPGEADMIMNHGAGLEDIPGVPSISVGHGLYWSRYPWHDNYQEVNKYVIENMRRAVAHTVPSEWVATSVRRGMLINPEVVYHGVDAQDWDETQEKLPFVLWNKARKDYVSDPEDMQKVASILPNTQFITTIGNKKPNVDVKGSMPYPQMKQLVQKAGVYLSTARETFGIGVLEALASGVPVVGWDWGGNSEIVVSGETGILVQYGNYDALAQAIHDCMADRKRMGDSARQDVLDRWGWESRILQYANIIREVKKIYAAPRPKVSVIVTCFNLAHYLKDCLTSVREQSFEDFECIIVDDCSTDDTETVGKEWDKLDKRFKYVRTPHNMKLSMARNFGISKSKGQYVIMLDADDMFDKYALEILSGELDKDWGIHIAYGHLDTFTDGDKTRKRNSWPFEQYDWYGQMAHLNQLPYSALVRREVYERSGGYRERHWRAEDANFWCRVTSLGFRAKKVTQASVLVYRMRNDSKSMGERGDGDWTAWYPWRLGASSGKEGHDLIRSNRGIDADLVPFGAQGKPKDMLCWPVHDRQNPFVSVIIPVGPGHEKYLIDAVESVFAQTYHHWELIVVNDTGKALDMAGMPYARVFNTKGSVGPASARDMGAKNATGQTLLWLDADDYLMPTALEKMTAVAIEQGDCVVYSDWLRDDGDISKPLKYHATKDFECGFTLRKMQHANAALVPKQYYFKIGGYDKTIPGWEDWFYYNDLQIAGLCSFRIPQALFVYRFRTGTQREKSFGMKPDLIDFRNAKYAAYLSGEKEMPCRKCPGGRASRRVPKKKSNIQPTAEIDYSKDIVQLEYVGLNQGPFTVRGPATGKTYRFGLDAGHKVRPVLGGDASEILLRNNNFRVMQPLIIKEGSNDSSDADFVGTDITK